MEGIKLDQIKVIIIDDDPQWLKVLVHFLNNNENILIVGTAQTKEQALSLMKSIDFDIVLLDIMLSENNYDGIEIAIEINQIRDSKIIMLTSLDEDEIIKKSFIAGAVQYISKFNYRDIPQLIRRVYRKRTPFEVLLEDYHRLKVEEELKELTKAEREVFDLVKQGLTHGQISNRLFKTERTIKNQVNHFLKKIGAHSCKEAIEKVSRKGL